MARPYSGRFLLELNRADPERIGIQLAKVCIQANLPATHVAEVFGVSRMAIHGWFRGKYVREKNYTKILNFIKAIQLDLNKGTLPVDSAKKAKLYLTNVAKDELSLV
jgi:predicted XRE-type DNA-binding protein